jgi:hypothetical protein
VKERRVHFKMAALFVAAFVMITVPSYGQQIFFQGFEVNNNGWNVLGGPYDATRVASGTHGVPSSSGNFHAEAAGPIQLDTSGGVGSAFTRWGGYGFTPGCGPSGCVAAFPPLGYVTKLDIYLNVGGGFANDTRFDWDSAINDPAGNFRRDNVFNGGFYNDAGPFGSGPRFVIAAGNNAGRSGADPRDPGHAPFVITTTGWYTFVHFFHNNGSGVLAVDFSILNSSGTVLNTWTRSDPSDIIGVTVGGNRYGWFPSQEFSFMAIDNSALIIVSPATYQLRHFVNLIAADSFIDITNNGASSTANLTGQTPPQNNINGDICVNIYAFAADEQEVACCSCLITPNALWSSSVKTGLLNSTLTPSFPSEVVVKMISTVPNVGISGTETCNPATISLSNTFGTTPGAMTNGLLAWGTTPHGFPTALGPSFQIAETPFLPATLSTAELARDVQECQFIQVLGSGTFGICKGCSNSGLGAAAQ